MKLKVILGSVRTNRQGIKLANFIVEFANQSDWKASLIDPQKYNLPLLDKMYKDYETKKAPPGLEELTKEITDADAFVVVSAEYNDFPPPALINLLDHFYDEYYQKAAGICTYSNGSFGGVRAGVNLRSFLSKLKLITTPSSLIVPNIQTVFDGKGQLVDEKYKKRTDKFLDELKWYAQALKDAREK